MPSVNELGEWVLRGLAVAGGATVGGFGTGLLTQLIARLTVARPLPRPALNVLRLLGAFAAGLLVWMWVFGSGGPGFGFGGGGLGLGGRETGTGGTGSGASTESRKELPQNNGTDPTAGPAVLRIEVLGDRPDERARFYRLDAGDPNARLTLDEIRAKIRDRKAQSPPLEKLVIVLYLDSPDKEKKQVRDLQELALDFKLRPILDAMDRKAP
ncbi:MAG TPA: hypothetical protein VGG61_06875 [Gemmataceae bacterium]